MEQDRKFINYYGITDRPMDVSKLKPFPNRVVTLSKIIAHMPHTSGVDKQTEIN